MTPPLSRAARLRGTASILFLIMLSAVVSAQTVRPLIDELGNPGKGRIEYVNDSLTPLNVVLNARSFSVSETGAISYRPLDTNIHVKLSATSFRIQPQQTFYVFYEATTDKAPAWFVIYAAFTGFPFRTQQGMNVQLELPHTVYLLPKEGLVKDQVRVVQAEYRVAEKKVVVDIENTGDSFGRVLQTTLTTAKKKQEAPGFPVFPHSHRIAEVSLADEMEAPDGIVLQFANFKVEEKIPAKSP